MAYGDEELGCYVVIGIFWWFVCMSSSWLEEDGSIVTGGL
jgi:hypothetical protein